MFRMKCCRSKHYPSLKNVLPIPFPVKAGFMPIPISITSSPVYKLASLPPGTCAFTPKQKYPMSSPSHHNTHNMSRPATLLLFQPLLRNYIHYTAPRTSTSLFPSLLLLLTYVYPSLSPLSNILYMYSFIFHIRFPFNRNMHNYIRTPIKQMVQFIRIAVATLLDQRKGVKTDISALSNSSNWHILSS